MLEISEIHRRRTKLSEDMRLMLEKAASLGARGVQYISTPKGATLMHESDAGTNAWFICTGRVRVFRITPDGTSIVLAHRSSGDIVGEMAVINALPRSGSIIAMEETRSILIPSSVFNDWLMSDVSFAAALVFQLSQRLRESSQQAFSIATAPIATRLAAELITLAVPMPGTAHSYIPHAPTITDFGARVNATRESVSKAFSALVTGGVVSRDKADFIIHDMVALTNMLPD
ncbi:MAG: Crp/Fnr family transcriptional regulator [Chakrabartia sp.]